MNIRQYLKQYKRAGTQRLEQEAFFVEPMEPRLLLSADALGMDFQSIDTGVTHNIDPLDPANAADWGTLTALS